MTSLADRLLTHLNLQVLAKASEIQEAISEGANSFLYTEYRYMGVFCVIMSVCIFSLLSSIQPEASEPLSF
jgi:inorganic pyrophosphatase